MRKKLLVLIVAYNHEKFIKSVLDRINDNLFKTYEVEVLINDDSSSESEASNIIGVLGLLIIAFLVDSKKSNFKI